MKSLMEAGTQPKNLPNCSDLEKLLNFPKSKYQDAIFFCQQLNIVNKLGLYWAKLSSN